MDTAPSARDAVEALILLFSNERSVLRPGTTRSYYAQVEAVVGRRVQLGELSPERAREGLAEIHRLIKARRGQPPQRTSAKKLKIASYLDYRKILNDFSRRAQSNADDWVDRVLALLLRVGPYVGLRPVEWLNATVSVDSLIVQNAKNSNGRAPGPVRTILLASLPPQIVGILGDLIGGIRALAALKSEWRKVLKLLGERLARVCRRLKLPRWSLYTLRHVAEATWKRAGLFPAEIAALSGHRATATSRRHYAGGRHGWSAHFACARPDARLVAMIEARNAVPLSNLASSRQAAVLEQATADGTAAIGFGVRQGCRNG